MTKLQELSSDYAGDEFGTVDHFMDQDKDLPTRMVSIYDIEFNPLNDQGDTQEELEEFAAVLHEEGQIRSPLNVYRLSDNPSFKYRLLGGDRRLHALLINAEKYEEAQRMVPVIIEKRPDNPIEEEQKILELNEHRSLTPEKQKRLVGRYLRIYRELEKEGKKPKGQVRKWIATKMNIGEKKAEKYIHEIEGYKRKKIDDLVEEVNAAGEIKIEEDLMPSAETEHRKSIVENMKEVLGRKVKINGTFLMIQYSEKKNDPNDDFYSVLNALGFDEEGIMK